MPTQRSAKHSIGTSTNSTLEKPFSAIDDQQLIKSLSKGDEAALRLLMDRHDRLVRYTIFRTARAQCVRDPQWLDAVASETWTGFLRSAQRSATINADSIAAYLVGIARRQTISALRRAEAFHQNPALTELLTEAGDQPDPASITANLELLTVLRQCASQLPTEDQLLMTQLLAITQRRWAQAAAALNMAESTLRSRWARVLDRLRACMEKKN